LLVFLIWGQISWRWYTSGIKGFYKDIPLSEMNRDTSKERDIKRTNEDSVIQVKGKRTIIFFPYKVVQRPSHDKVETYLIILSEDLKAKNSNVMITGFTDDKGSEYYNYELGLERAHAIARILREYGVDDEQIKVSSKGESEPFIPHEKKGSEEMNRRVEVEMR